MSTTAGGNLIRFQHYSKISFICFSGFRRKTTYDTRKHLNWLHVFLLKESQVKQLWPRRVLWRFERCSRTPHFPANGSTFVTYPMQLRCCLNTKTLPCTSACAVLLGLLLFWFHFGSRFTAAKSKISRLLAIGFASSWPWFRVIQNGNEWHDAHGAVTKKGTRVEWQSSN